MWWVAIPAGTVIVGVTTIILTLQLLSEEFAIAASNATSGSTGLPPITSLPIYHIFEYLDVASFIVSVIFLYLVYVLILRRNQHFERQQRVFYDTAFIMKQTIISRKGELSAEERRNLSWADATMNTMRYAEMSKSALLWVVLLIVPLVDIVAYFYIYHFLMKDFAEHEANEDSLLAAFSSVRISLGLPTLPIRKETLGERNFVLYLVADILTLGLFNIYWVYVLIKDPNQHFRTDAQIENELVSSTLSLSASPVNT
jgi:predicted permease